MCIILHKFIKKVYNIIHICIKIYIVVDNHFVYNINLFYLDSLM